MKKIVLVILCIVCIVSCKKNNESVSEAKGITPDSVANWFSQNFGEVELYTPDSAYHTINDSIIIKFMTNVYPKVKAARNKVIGDIDSYQNIAAVVGTNGRGWVVFEKFRSKVKGSSEIQYFYYSTWTNRTELIPEEVYPDSWLNMMEVNANEGGMGHEVPVPYQIDEEDAKMLKGFSWLLNKEGRVYSTPTQTFILENGEIRKAKDSDFN